MEGSGLSNGTTGWFVDDDPNMVVAYRLSDQSRDAAKDIDPGAGDWRGGLSDGTTGWFANTVDPDMAVAYRLPRVGGDTSVAVQGGSTVTADGGTPVPETVAHTESGIDVGDILTITIGAPGGRVWIVPLPEIV